MAAENKIDCPNCGQTIDVNEILYHKLDEDLRKKYADKSAKDEKRLAEKSAEIEKQQKSIEKQQADIQKQIAEGVSSNLASERAKIIAEEKAKAEKAQSDSIALLQKELADSNERLKELNKAQAEVEKIKREKDRLEESLKLENEKQLNKQLTEERKKIRRQEAEKAELKVGEKDHVIQQLTEQLKEAHRKAEQGSMQIQGEVQELAIEEWLQDKFPLDVIEEIKKGAQGGDCIQHVNTRTAHNCGMIYYESKRTKSFQPSWIEKFKNDIRARNADIGVLVTEAMPPDMDRLGMRDGIWICNYEEFKGLCEVLRQTIVMLSDATASEENKGEKMAMLYSFLTSNEFKLQVEGIVEGFTQMKADLDTEKRSIQGHWKKREKQIEKVLLNTNHMYSSIRGIAGTAIQAVPMLELTYEEGEGDNES